MIGLVWKIKKMNDLYISVPYAGKNYMVVKNSKRHMYLHDAQTAYKIGCLDMATDLHLRAIKAPGCAFEHRMGVRHA